MGLRNGKLLHKSTDSLAYGLRIIFKWGLVYATGAGLVKT
jgi:hypothetical protein